jgi:hypothetical protein
MNHAADHKPEKHFDSQDGKFCTYEVYRKSQRTIYYLRGSQAKFVGKIILEGYAGLPTGLYLNRNGYGFGKKGTFLLSSLKSQVPQNKQLDLVISKTARKSFRTGALNVTVVLRYEDVRSLLSKLAGINEDSNNELRAAVASFLSTKFPSRIKISTEDFDEYRAGEVAALLRKKKVARKLNEEDLQSLNLLFPTIFESSIKGTKKVIRAQREQLISNTKAITDKIFLDEVIKEFNANLEKKSLNENVWQAFLKDKVFRFLASYVTTIEKQNVSLDISYPDFVLVDVYGFVDVFEIKRQDTELLAFDDSHENYYWKPDIAKAIAQIENYIDSIVSHADEYVRSIRRKKHVDIRVVRPRGYIIAGSSKSFGSKKESDDFRKLGSSLKNISFILYDELLESLKNLRSKL